MTSPSRPDYLCLLSHETIAWARVALLEPVCLEDVGTRATYRAAGSRPYGIGTASSAEPDDDVMALADGELRTSDSNGRHVTSGGLVCIGPKPTEQAAAAAAAAAAAMVGSGARVACALGVKAQSRRYRFMSLTHAGLAVDATCHGRWRMA